MAALLLPLGSYGQTQQQKQIPQPPKIEQRPAPPTVASPVTVEREKSVEPNWSKPSCDKPQNHDEADLCQQIRMSEAAEQSVGLNKIQAAVALVGALFVIVTIYYARKAAIAARDAAVHTEAGAKAANESASYGREANQLARDHAELQLRANLLIDSVTLAPGKTPLTAHVTIKNYGQTPAYDVRAWIGIGIHDFPLRNPLSPPPDDFLMSVSILAPVRRPNSTSPCPVCSEMGNGSISKRAPRLSTYLGKSGIAMPSSNRELPSTECSLTPSVHSLGWLPG
jgi:hypothetical protein